MEYLDYDKLAPDGMRAMVSLHRYLQGCGMEQRLRDLVFLRISQINGCAYCVDLHSRDLRSAGDTERRVQALTVWREAPFYSSRERVALAWAEALTELDDRQAIATARAALQAEFGDKQVIDLTYAIGLMNALNRLGIGSGKAPAELPAAG